MGKWLGRMSERASFKRLNYKTTKLCCFSKHDKNMFKKNTPLSAESDCAIQNLCIRNTAFLVAEDVKSLI